MNSEIKNLSDRTRLTDNTDNNKCWFDWLDGCRKKLGTQVQSCNILQNLNVQSF